MNQLFKEEMRQLCVFKFLFIVVKILGLVYGDGVIPAGGLVAFTQKLIALVEQSMTHRLPNMNKGIDPGEFYEYIQNPYFGKCAEEICRYPHVHHIRLKSADYRRRTLKIAEKLRKNRHITVSRKSGRDSSEESNEVSVHHRHKYEPENTKDYLYRSADSEQLFTEPSFFEFFLRGGNVRRKR